MKRILMGAVFAAAFAAAPALAAEPAVIYDMGGKFDKSFNEAAYNGAEKFKTDKSATYRDYEVTNESQREQALRKFARDGFNPIVVMGFAQAAALEVVAKEFPDTKFAIIDMVVDLPNVKSIVFNEHEGSYLVGIIAAMASKTGKVGFVGGMDIPLISKFACGYVQGVKSVNPDIEVFQNMTGTTPAAWNDPTKAGELAKSHFDRGADVVYAAAGGSGLGVLQTAADQGKYSIGVDSNQNYLHPGSVLTSMLKRVDVAVYETFEEGTDAFKPGIQVMGLPEDGVGWALDEHNKALITPEMQAAVDKAKADIISGAVKVVDYTQNGNACPVS